MKSQSRSPAAWFGVAIFLAAVAYLVHRLHAQGDDLVAKAASVGAGPLFAALVCAMIALVFQAWYHLLVLERLADSRMPRRRVLASYYQALLVRYLPGKVWGLFYQSHYLSAHVRSVHVVLANVFQSLMSMLLTVAVAGVVLAAVMHSPLWILALLPVLALIELIHRQPNLELAALGAIARWLPRLQLPRHSRMRALPWRGTALLGAEWIAFLASFIALLWGMTGVLDAVILGVWYAGASLLSLAAVAVPAGIGVREAIFLSLPPSSGHGITLLAITAVLARLVQTAAEVLLATVALIVRKDQDDG